MIGYRDNPALMPFKKMIIGEENRFCLANRQYLNGGPHLVAFVVNIALGILGNIVDTQAMQPPCE